MAKLNIRKSLISNGLWMGLVALATTPSPAMAAATAQSVRFVGNPLWLIGIGAFVVIVLGLAILGALRSDRLDRGHSTADGFWGIVPGNDGGHLHLH